MLEALEDRLALDASAALSPALFADPANVAILQEPFQVGDAFVNLYAVNRQSLVPDPVTDPAAWNYTAGPGPVPMQSPWGSAIVLPEVPYDAIMTGTAAQPDLDLPDNLISEASLTNGITFQAWFQAKNPGALLTADLTQSGSTHYQAPLIYIDYSGKLVAGLFDPTPLTVQQLDGQNPTIFSWKDADGLGQIAAANPLVSQRSVVDNTWHHVAFVASSQGQALYLDGLLQGISKPLNHDTFTSTSSLPVTSLSVPLSGKPVNGGQVQGSIWENGYQAYTFEFSADSQVTVTPNVTYNEVQFGNGYPINKIPPFVVQELKYDGSGATGSLTLTLGSAAPANALTVHAAYATESSAYHLAPNTPGVSFSGALSVGAAILPEPASNPHPEINYPQGYIGTIDEVALWTTQLTPAQVQAAMTAPVSQDDLSAHLTAYFNFDLPPVDQAYSNQAPGGVGKAQGPSTGTTLVRVLTTIPTDPFPNAKPLAGARDWGLGLMTPLASSSVRVDAGPTVAYKAVLAAGDQLGIKRTEAHAGTLKVTITSDTGVAIATDQTLEPGFQQHLGVSRTGTYQIELKWTPNDTGQFTVVSFSLLPGPLNSLTELLASYQENVSATTPVYAYSAADLAGANPAPGTAPAPYWPLWSDTKFFPVPVGGSAQWSTELNAAYNNLVAKLPLNAPLSDFSNVNGANVTLPIGNANTKGIQQYLDDAYKAAYGPPPPLPQSGPFPVNLPPNTTPQDAVYRFLYNANLLRQNFYEVLFGGSANPSSVTDWVQQVINGISGASNVPVDIANTIFTGLAEQVQNLPLQVPDPASNQSAAQIAEGAAEWAIGGILTALFTFLGPEGTLIGAALGGAAASLANSFTDMAGAGRTLNATVSVTPITNNQLDYSKLNAVATSLSASLIQQWNALLNAINSDAFVQSVMSNYGLLEALQTISSAPLSDQSMAPGAALDQVLTNASWRTMIPAVFQWQPVQPYDYLSVGQTTNLIPQTVSLDSTADDPAGIVSADFNNDKFPDLATANSGSSTLSVLLNKGLGGGFVAHMVSLSPINQDGPNGAIALTVGDFDGDGHPDLAVADFDGDGVSVLLNKQGDGSFPRIDVHTIDPDGFDEPRDITVGDFNHDGHPDLAVANSGEDDVIILLNNGDGVSYTPHTQGLGGPDGAAGIVSGDFNGDGLPDLAVANADGHVTVLLNQGSGVSYTVSNYDLLDGAQAADITIGDFNGDGHLDLAAVMFLFVEPDFESQVSVLTGDGRGAFTPTTLSSVSTPAARIAVRDWNGDKFQDLIVGMDGTSVFLNQGNGKFFAPISYAPDNGVPVGITTGDFNRDGLNDIAYTTLDNNVAILFSGTIGNFATFLPDQAASLGVFLDQMKALQGSNTVTVGPYDSTSLITPPTSTPPNYMAHISLPYAPDSGPLRIVAPGWFLTMTPATMEQTASGFSYTQSGTSITGWTLYDANNNPISLATAQQLFGLPTLPTDGATGPITGSNLTPINAQAPIAGLNGGWYYGVKTAADAATTWAEAFFAWGLGTGGYSPRILVPNYEPSSGTGTQIGTLPGTSESFSDDFQFVLTFSPALKGPASAENDLHSFQDNFNRPNGANLGPSWNDRLGGFAIQNNTARGNNAINIATLNGLTAADVTVQTQIGALGANGELIGLVARYSGPGDSNQYHGMVYNSGGTARAVIYRHVGGTWTMISADVAVGSVASVVGRTLRFEVQGSSQKLFLDNTLVAFSHDTTISGAGSVGIRTLGMAALGNFQTSVAPAPANGSLGTTYTFESPQRPDAQLDNVWTEQLGNFAVKTVAADNVAGGNGTDNLATLNGISADNVVVQAQVKGLANGELIGLAARYSGPGMGNQYQGILYNANGTARAVIYRNVGGTWTAISADVAVGSIASVLNSTLRFEVHGASLKLFLNNTLVAVTLDTMISGAGGVAMRTVGTASLDNFRTDLAPPPANGSLGVTYTFQSPQRPDGQLDNMWTEQTGNFKVVNVAGSNVAAGNNGDNLATLNGISVDNVIVQAQVKGLANGELIGLSARYSGPGMGNQYQGILYNSNGTARAVIYRNVGGTWTMISADVAVGSVASVVGKTLRFEVQGSSLKLFLDNTLAAFSQDTAISGAGGVAMRTVGTASLDNFMANQTLPPANGSLGTTYTFESPQRPDGQLDNVWKEQTGNFKVANVAGNNVAMGNGGDNLATLNGINATNLFVQAQVKSLANGELIGLSARYSGPGVSNQYQGILYNSGGTARAVIYRNVGGVWTMISADVAVGSIASVLNSTLRFELTGSSLRLFVGASLVTSTTDTAISGPGGVGMRLVGSASLDNFTSA